jgi:hypothetical protein
MAIVLSVKGRVSESVRQCMTCDQSALVVAQLLVVPAPPKLNYSIGQNETYL